MALVLSNKGKGMQSSSEQPLVGEESKSLSLEGGPLKPEEAESGAINQLESYEIFMQHIPIAREDFVGCDWLSTYH